jgi:hypothetical protein
MNDQLFLGAALGAVGVAAAISGVLWLATAALAAAIPFAVVGLLFALGANRARHDRAAGSIH